MRNFALHVLLLAAVGSSSADENVVLSLTPNNFKSETAGKTVFIRFFAPWYVQYAF